MQEFINAIIRFPKTIAALLLIVTLGAAYYGQMHFAMNADLSHLVKQEGAWRDNLNALDDAFPQSANVLVVVSGAEQQQTRKVATELANAFEKQALFGSVFAPVTYTWFDKYALGFLSEPEFAALADNAALLVPGLVTASKASSLNRYLGALDSKLSANELDAEQVKTLLTPLVSSLNGQNVTLDKLIQRNPSQPKGYVIALSANEDFSQTTPNKIIIETVRSVIDASDIPQHINVNITGQAALDYDEIQDASQSVAVAGAVSLFSLVCILAVGIRSLRIILASYIAVMVGLIWTFAAGLLLIGSFNTISIVFMVIFIGLGVDFAVHLSLHIYEQRLRGYDNQKSLVQALSHCISPLGLCALSSAIGFLSFYPTAYTGLGELGVISASGMALGLIATFIVIPLFFQLFGYPKVKLQNAKRSKFALALGDMLARYEMRIIVLTVFAALVTGVVATKFRFDFSTLVLKNPDSESVQTLQWLQDNQLGSSYQLYMLAKDEQQAQQWQQQFNQMPEVSTAVTAHNFIPSQYQARVQTLHKLMSMPQSNASSMPLEDFVTKYGSYLKVLGLNAMDEVNHQAVLERLTYSLPLLEQASRVVPPTMSQLPRSIYNRYISKSGEWLVSVSPSGDMRNVVELDAFIEAVQSVVPKATGRAVAEQQVGRIIVKAFYTAIALSIAGISVILLFTVRYKLDILFIFIPLLLTTTTTLSITHWFGQSLNMANIIVVPLIFGLGVDNGIHIVKRYRHEQTMTRFFSSSTPKATLISCFTTIATFGALMLTDHQGMYSIGLLLTIALTAVLCFSLLILPAFLHRFEPSR
ncbi:MMPL family transporter [Vibrio gallicus]|uniref:MMPL family transporter n=1 Tax=Vibrio gallicus TaxID=190897 RepID=UPI0021C44F5A|nr:MMPL family transporter [Vibrio gallicus]